MPSKYGSHKTVWERHKKWSEQGVWKAIMDSLVSHGYVIIHEPPMVYKKMRKNHLPGIQKSALYSILNLSREKTAFYMRLS